MRWAWGCYVDKTRQGLHVGIAWEFGTEKHQTDHGGPDHGLIVWVGWVSSECYRFFMLRDVCEVLGLLWIVLDWIGRMVYGERWGGQVLLKGGREGEAMDCYGCIRTYACTHVCMYVLFIFIYLD